MDGGQAIHGANPAASATNGPESIALNKPASPSTTNSRHSPVAPLAPLEYLQNQRRGSITDPSLHVAGASGVTNLSNSPPGGSKPASSRQPDPSATLAKLQSSPPYRFGAVSPAQPSESTSPLLRRLLRSPSAETGSGPPEGSEQSREAAGQEFNASRDDERMQVDAQHPHEQQPRPPAVDYETRRPSLAGTKRKMTPDSSSSTADIDPQLIGPGVPSGVGADTEGPAPKRRSSAFDTQRLAQLNLYDNRRSSMDSRVGTPGGSGGVQGQWWTERREPATPVFANTPVSAGGYPTPSSAIPGDPPHGRPPPGIATFAWPAANPQAGPAHQPHSPQLAHDHAMANAQGPYDPNLAMMPPGSFPQDRRMSLPAIAPENIPTSPTAGPTRALRSRSRPSSRARANQSAGTSTEQSPGPSTSAPEDAATSSHPSSKEPGSTPYSRSPELRVSHKLAERKRRKEMKDLFDELRDQLPADRGMKASKWEILSKAIDFISTLKQSHQEMSREIDMMRHELEGFRQGMPPPFGPGAPPHPVVYGHGPPVGVPQFPTGPPGPAGPPGPSAPSHAQHVPPQHAVQPPLSRPNSSQNVYPPNAVPVHPPPNGNAANPPTENPS